LFSVKMLGASFLGLICFC